MEHLYTLTHAHPCTLTFSPHTHTHTHFSLMLQRFHPSHPSMRIYLPDPRLLSPLQMSGTLLITALNSQALTPDEACLLSGNTPLPRGPGQSGIADHTVQAEAPPALPRRVLGSPRGFVSAELTYPDKHTSWHQHPHSSGQGYNLPSWGPAVVLTDIRNHLGVTCTLIPPAPP